MGGITKALFGGSDNKSSSNSVQNSTSTSSSESGNNAFNYLTGALAPSVSTGTNAMGTIAALLGVGGDPAAANAGFNNYLNSSGYNFMMDQGSRAITGNAAAKGLLQSGSTAKGLTSFGQGLGSQYFNNYLTNLGSLVTGGQNAANTIAGAGAYSKSNSSSNSSGTSTSSGKGGSQNGIIPGLFG